MTETIRIPLLRDNHNHFFTYSALDEAVRLSQCTSKSEALKILSQLPDNQINVVIGWYDSYYTFTADELNALPPLIICNNSLHKYVFNSRGSDFVMSKYPDFAVNISDKLWVEQHIMQILSFLSGIFAFDRTKIRQNVVTNLKLGVCYATDMFVTSDEIFDFMVSERPDYTAIWTDPDLYPTLKPAYKDVCKGIKLFTDGALGACTAAIAEYKIDAKGFFTYTDKQLRQMLERVLSYKVDLAIHSIGECAILQLLNALHDLRKQISCKIRLEHLQFITEAEAHEAKNLGCILSMQPNFSAESEIYKDRLTDKYRRWNNPFRMLIDKAGFVPGNDLILGSDGMPTGIEGALHNSLFPTQTGQQLSINEFVAAYCTNNLDKGCIDVNVDFDNKTTNFNVIIK